MKIISTKKSSPPRWAVLERQLMENTERAIDFYLDKYVRADGTLKWREFWPGMDGSDDAYESFQNFPLFYALGASEKLLKISHAQWDTVTWQWTEYGQLSREFFSYYDWMHHGEGSLFLYYMGFADPYSLKFSTRARRFAGFYIGEDDEASNYDKERKLIKGPINGSKGPRHHHTGEDWQTHRTVLDNYLPPFEDMPGIPFGNTCPWSDDEKYKVILDYINKRMAKGDVPLNLNATSLVTHAYIYTGEEKYKAWVLEYLSAWETRTKRNGGIIPDNVGLNDVIGENMDGKWWGGYYGWRWPHGALTVVEPLINAGCNALLLTGDDKWLNLARSQLDILYSMGIKNDKGETLIPHRHYDTGWGDYRKENTKWPVYLWSVTQNEEDKKRIARLPDQEGWGVVPTRLEKGNRMAIHPWYHYLIGKNPNYPTETLQANINAVVSRLEEITADSCNIAEQDIHHWQDKNPVVCEALIQLMWGGSTNIYHGGLMYTALRYFYDGRPGLPKGVAALVESVDKESVTLSLYNLSDKEQSFTVQGGAFGEHKFKNARVDGEEYLFEINDRLFDISMQPETLLRLHLSTQRFALNPTYKIPGKQADEYFKPIIPRQIEN